MPAPVNVGDTLVGKYKVERVLGEGAMGVVVAARHLQLGERVAIKFLLPSALAREDLVSRFLREGRTAARIRSEHVARVFDVGTLEDGSSAPYLVMEYLEGQDLGAVLDQQRSLPVTVAVDYVLQACEAIAEAHAVGIIHRDLKPSNLFLTRRSDGTDLIKLIDFGISKLMDRGDGVQMTHASMVMGSPLYMAPEQMESARDADTRSDIWSLGAILFHLITGSPPFKATTLLRIRVLIAETVPSVEKLRPGVPWDLEAVILRCLQQEKSARFSSVAELAAALAEFGPARARRHAESIARILGVTENTVIEDASANEPRQPPLSPPGVQAPSAPLPIASAPAPMFLLDMAPRPGIEAATPRGAPLPIAAPPSNTAPRSIAASAPSAAPRSFDAAGTESIEKALEEAIAAFGIAGTIVLKDLRVELHGRGAPVAIEAGPIAEQWALLPPDMRQRSVGKIARRLADAHRAAHASMHAPAGERAVSPRLLGYVAGALALGALGLGGRYYWVHRTPDAPVGVPQESDAQRQDRLARSCDAMRSNIYGNKPIGPYEKEGWVVELWLARRSGEDLRPALAGVDAGGRLASSVHPELALVSDGTLKVMDDEVSRPGSATADAASPSFRSVKLLFGGGYAREYLDPDKHDLFRAVASRLADTTNADMGALYGRCAHLKVHEFGSWFRGRDAGAAATALVYSMGMFAETTVVDRAKIDAAGALDSLRVAAKLDSATLSSLVGAQNVASAGGAVTLTFPIGGPTLATRASRAVANKMGVGMAKE